MKALKNIGYGCGTLFLIGIICFIGLVVLVGVKKSKYDEISGPFFDEVIPILSEWNHKELQPYLAPEVLVQYSDEKLEKYFSAYKRLGELIRYNDPQFVQVGASTEIPYKSYVRYKIAAEYENGTAWLNWVLVTNKNDRMLIWRLDIDSEVFIVPLEPSDEVIADVIERIPG